MYVLLWVDTVRSPSADNGFEILPGVALIAPKIKSYFFISHDIIVHTNFISYM